MSTFISIICIKLCYPLSLCCMVCGGEREDKELSRRKNSGWGETHAISRNLHPHSSRCAHKY